MKKRMIILALFCVSALFLTACTRSDTSSSSAGAEAVASDTTGSGTASASTAAGSNPTVTLVGGASDVTGQTLDTAGTDAAAQSQQVQTYDPAQTVTAGQSTGTAASTDAVQQIPSDDDTAISASSADDSDDEDIQTVSDDELYGDDDDDDQSAAEAGSASQWIGTYVQSGGGETLTISNVDAGGFYFGFSVCGISSYASLDGSAAIYHGDDDNDVVFEISGDVIYISVSNSYNYDTSEASMSGTYIRQ